MNWYPTTDSSVITTDTYINKAVYNGMTTQGEGIDLRQELHWLLYGKDTFPSRVPKGHWIVYRRFNNEKSEYYSKRTHEGIGGPPTKYTDIFIRTRKAPVANPGILNEQPGIALVDKWNYYFEYTFKPEIGDDILEFEWPDHRLTPTSTANLKFTDRFSVNATSDYRLENGNIQYYMATCELHEVRY